MLTDSIIHKPVTMDAYALHQMVAGLTADCSDRPLFCDRGDTVVVRSVEQIADGGGETSAVPAVAAGQIRCIELRASCFVSSGGKKYFIKPSDWKGRHDWLRKKGQRHGFEVLTVNCTSKPARIQKKGGSFTLDCTDFTATIKVTDADKFADALKEGVGTKGRAFGFGMIIL